MAFKVVGFKMPQEMSDRIDECVAHLGVQRTAWVRNLIAKALEESGFPLDPKFLKTNQGRRTDMVSPEGRSRAKAQLAEARRRRKVRMLEREARACERGNRAVRREELFTNPFPPRRVKDA